MSFESRYPLRVCVMSSFVSFKGTGINQELGPARAFGPILFSACFVILGLKQLLVPQFFVGQIDPNDNALGGLMHVLASFGALPWLVRFAGVIMVLCGLTSSMSVLIDFEDGGGWGLWMSDLAQLSYIVLIGLLILYSFMVHNFWDVDTNPAAAPGMSREALQVLRLKANRQCSEEFVGFMKNVALIGAAIVLHAIQHERSEEMIQERQQRSCVFQARPRATRATRAPPAHPPFFHLPAKQRRDRKAKDRSAAG